MRATRLTAASIVVACPKCNAPYASPSDGSHQWEAHQIKMQSGQQHACRDCDTPFVIKMHQRIHIT